MALSSIKGLKCFLKPEGEELKHKIQVLGSNSNYLDTGFYKMQGMTYMSI